MDDFKPSKEDQAYWKGVMDGIAFSEVEADTWRSNTERTRRRVEKMKHTHYSSMLGPYCVVCHIGFDKTRNDYSHWADGQEAI